MPTSPMRNLAYRAALPIFAPRWRGEHTVQGVNSFKEYEKILRRHHVMGASLLLVDGDRRATVYSGCGPETLFRVASITKMATALVTLRLCEEGLLALDQPVEEVLPKGHDALRDVTVRHLLSHTSGLRDTGEAVLLRGGTYLEALRSGSRPGEAMVYCNLGFGLLGCVMEHVTGQSLESVFQEKLFAPLGMRATLEGASVDERIIQPIYRVLPYRREPVTVTELGRKPLSAPDPLRHFGHTAGAMYTDAASLSKLLSALWPGGFLSEALTNEMRARQAATPDRVYGLGLVLLTRPELSRSRLLGHQGFAYGCVDGAFVEEGTGRQVIFLNGGASEARTGRLGLVNRDVLKWALNEEMPSWT